MKEKQAENYLETVRLRRFEREYDEKMLLMQKADNLTTDSTNVQEEQEGNQAVRFPKASAGERKTPDM